MKITDKFAHFETEKDITEISGNIFFLMIRRPPRSTPLYSSAASDVYKRQDLIPLAKFEGEINSALILNNGILIHNSCLLYTSPSPRDRQKSRMPSSA